MTIRRRAVSGAPPSEIQIPRGDVEQGTGLAAALHLADGDVISVPEAGHVFVRGEVISGGVYDLTASAKTVLDMINAAGGFTKYARKDGVFITRIVDGHPKKIELNRELTTLVLANDVIEVPRRKW